MDICKGHYYAYHSLPTGAKRLLSALYAKYIHATPIYTKSQPILASTQCLNIFKFHQVENRKSHYLNHLNSVGKALNIIHSVTKYFFICGYIISKCNHGTDRG